jgi:hypothetical protein
MGLTPIRFNDKMGKAMTIGLQNLTASVCGPAIDDDEVQIRIVLVKYGIQAITKKSALVIADGDH